MQTLRAFLAYNKQMIKFEENSAEESNRYVYIYIYLYEGSIRGFGRSFNGFMEKVT